MECTAPRSTHSGSEYEAVHEPGNAPGFSSRVVGEKTVLTSSAKGVQPGGGIHFAAAQADTGVVNHSVTLGMIVAALQDASASPPSTMATLLSPLEILLAASSRSFAG